MSFEWYHPGTRVHKWDRLLVHGDGPRSLPFLLLAFGPSPRSGSSDSTMPSLRSAVLWIALGALAAAAPAEHAHKVKETVRAPRGFTALRPAPPGHIIEFRIGLPQPNFAVLEEHLYAVRCACVSATEASQCRSVR